MAAILVAGAIPSGLAAIIKDYRGLIVCRFFIGILGSTFVSRPIIRRNIMTEVDLTRCRFLAWLGQQLSSAKR